MKDFERFFAEFSLPQFGTAILAAILVAAAYTFALAIGAGAGRPRLLQAARQGAYGTIALVGVAVLTLAYGFVSHDFRLSYVARYSDRSMSTAYLFAALWGGQDGSLLWWLFLSSVFSGACVFWMRRKYLELQPYVIATLMTVLGFFAVVMVFVVNPFAISAAGAPEDGAGLNYQLRNFYMIIHPPSLYIGFTSAAVPFAFAVAALVTGRLDNEWIVAVRKWMLFSWLFLSIGNALGMLWAYEELGWGGPWAWDPVENAAFLPWLAASAYVHSTMIQERRGMMKVWNVSLICLTFFLTIFGTFLTRSGLIASVHAFTAEQNNIREFFGTYLILIVVACVALILYRLPRLKSDASFETPLSREAAFLGNNWGLLSLAVFIALATTWPYLSEKLLERKSTLGPTFYNQWIPPIALTVFGLMGVAPLLGWRKTSPELFRKSFFWPLVVTAAVAIVHLTLGSKVLFPAFVTVDPLYETTLGRGLAKLAGVYPFITVSLAAFNIAVVAQEFARGIAARQRAHKEESAFASLFELVAKSRRRYGGYVVHVGIAVMFLGFAGRAWGIDKEVSLKPGESMEIAEYKVTYLGSRMEVDEEKRMVFADVEVLRNGAPAGKLHPAKFIYKASPQAPSTEVDRRSTFKNDLYVVIGMVNPSSKIASFQIHVNQLISFIWVGVLVLIVGALVSMWPDFAFDEAGAFSYVRAAGAVGATVVFGFLMASGASAAYAAPSNKPFSEEPPTYQEPQETAPAPLPAPALSTQ